MNDVLLTLMTTRLPSEDANPNAKDVDSYSEDEDEGGVIESSEESTEECTSGSSTGGCEGDLTYHACALT